MSPVLTPSGLMLALVGGAFVVAGVLVSAWPLLALGFAVISALLVLYVVFVSPAALLRRRGLELAWWVPPAESAGGALLAGRPLTLHLMLRNRSPFRLSVPRLRVVASSAIELAAPPTGAALPPRQELRLRLSATPRAAGHWFFQGVSLQVTDRFGLFGLQLYFPSLLGIKVFPRLGLVRETIPFHPSTGTPHERVGRRLLRQRGLGSDLREIREHIPGDPFKRVAWKATARTRKLMVREYESEVLVTHWLLLDVSSTMRSEQPGGSKLDYGINLCAAFARLALDAGDQLGMATFDHRVYSRVKPDEGRTQLFRVIEALMELHNIVDEDLTDLTDAELYAAAADYLAYQEGLSVTLAGKAPPPDHPARAGLLEGPRGQLYSSAAMEQAVSRVLEKRRENGPARWWRRIVASTPLSAQLRLFCRLSGVEIPYHRHSPLLSKGRGMAEALRQVATARQSRFVVLVSDLEELSGADEVFDALRLARRRGHSVVVVAPFGPRFLAPSEEEHAARVQEIFAMRARRQRREVAGRVERLGIPVLSAGPAEALPLLLRRLSRFRMARGGRPR